MGMGLGLAGAAGGADDAFQRLIAQKVMQQKTAEDNRRALVEEQQRQQQLDQSAQGRQDALKETTYQHRQNAEAKSAEDFSRVIHDTPPAIGDVVSSQFADQADKYYGGTLVTRQTPVLASTAYAGGGTLPGAAQPDAFASATPQEAHGAQAVYRGTGAQRTQQAQQQQLGRLITLLPQGSKEVEALQYEQATGKPAPAGMFDKPPAKDPVPHYSFIQGYENGQPGGVLRGNTLTGELTPAGGAQVPIRPPVVAPGAAQEVEAKRAKTEALGILDQLDASITDASGLIGPGYGRVSNIEQLAGNADPKIQTLAVKMKAAKMAVDHAITGSVRAGASPTLIQQWDNILANNITPEGLKAGVQAMREVLGSGTSPAISAPTPAAGAPQAPTGWKYVPKPGGGWTAVEAK